MFSPGLAAVVAKSDKEGHGGWLPLWMHSMDTAGVMEYLVQDWVPQNIFDYLSTTCGGEEQVLPVVKFCALTHDIGKLTAVFQSRIAEAVHFSPFGEYASFPKCKYPTKTPHPWASAAILLQYACPNGIASIAGAHHGKPTTYYDGVEDQICCYPENYYGKQKTLYEAMWKEWITFSLKETGFTSMEDLPDIPVTAQVLICGLLIIADWIASNPTYFPLLSTEERGNIADYPARVQHGWEKVAFPEPWISDAQFGLDREAFQLRFGFAPNGTQEEVLETVNEADSAEIYILEAPMGLGKNEAALGMAEVLAARSGAGGLFFGMPTQATSNGIYKRLEKWAAGLTESEGVIHAIRLAHAAAVLNEDYRELLEGHSNVSDETIGLIVHEWFSGRKQAMLPNFVTGTIDQMLMAGLKQRHVMLRHIGLAGKVVVVDECHAYDAYMSRYLDTAIKWLGSYKVPVIILSATLPAKRRAELVEAYLGDDSDDAAWKHEQAYPLLTYTDNGIVKQKKLSYRGENKEITIERISDENIVDSVGYAVQCGGCVGVIVNTVKKAQEIAATLRMQFPENRIIVLHSQFIMTERASREKLILELVGKNSTEESRRGRIVVGTQVLEQSLDLDFDQMITELCPMDLLLQRMGRLHRHIRVRPHGLENAKCYVVDTFDEAFDEGSRAVYGEWLLARTRSLLPQNITIPGDIPLLVQKTYDEDDVSMFAEWNDRLQRARDEYDLIIHKKEDRAGNYLIGDPPDLDDPYNNTLDGFLDNDIRIGEQNGEMAVRDGDPSIDVIALQLCADGKVRLITEDTSMYVPTDRPPSKEEALKIARQKLRLPGYFSKKWVIDDVIRQLEKDTQTYFGEWKYSSLLKEELALLFDDTQHATIGETTLWYDMENGLKYEKEKG